MTQILCVEDEETLRRDLMDYMALQGFQVQGVSTAQAAMDLLEGSYRPDVILLDINLPDGNGFDLAGRIRAKTECGIIMLTAVGDLESRVRGFESGADIYLVKHTSLREISAAVQSLVRRLAHVKPATPKDIGQTWTLDEVNWSLCLPDGQSVKLTATEKLFIEALITQEGKPCTRDELAEILSVRDAHFDNRRLDTVVSRLRRKVMDVTGHELPVKSIYGVGYLFSATVQIHEAAPDQAR